MVIGDGEPTADRLSHNDRTRNRGQMIVRGMNDQPWHGEPGAGPGRAQGDAESPAAQGVSAIIAAAVAFIWEQTPLTQRRASTG
jgi:hypothetical protein